MSISEKPDQVRVLVSKAEKARLQAAAAREHLPLSVWLRSLGLKEADRLLGEAQ